MSMVNAAAPKWYALCDECSACSKQRKNQSDVPVDWKSRMRSLRCPECERNYQETIASTATTIFKAKEK